MTPKSSARCSIRCSCPPCKLTARKRKRDHSEGRHKIHDHQRVAQAQVNERPPGNATKPNRDLYSRNSNSNNNNNNRRCNRSNKLHKCLLNDTTILQTTFELSLIRQVIAHATTSRIIFGSFTRWTYFTNVAFLPFPTYSYSHNENISKLKLLINISK